MASSTPSTSLALKTSSPKIGKKNKKEFNSMPSSPLSQSMQERSSVCSNSILDNIHRCPVCKLGLCDDDGLSMKQNYLKYKRDAEFLRRKLEDGWEGKMLSSFNKKNDEDAIVAATCGELFHKKCLMKFCSTHFSGRKMNAGGKRIGCPRCGQPIMYSLHRDVDLDSHRVKAGGSGLFGKLFNEHRLKNQELIYKRDKELKRMLRLQDKVQVAKTKLDQARASRSELEEMLPVSKLLMEGEIRKVMRRRQEKIYIEGYILKAQRVIEFMQKETPNTMRLYLNEVQSKPLDEIPKSTPIPRMLIPYLHKIADDDYCLFALSQVVEPRPYPGIRFQLDDLLLGILRKVNPGLCENLVARSKKSGSSVMRTYDEMFPDTCLKILKSFRDLKKKNKKKREAEEEVAESGGDKKGGLRDSRGNELEITIMYMVDEEEQGNLQVPSTQHLLAEKASNFQMDSSSTNLSSSYITEADEDDEEDPLPPANSNNFLKNPPSLQEVPPNSSELRLEEVSSSFIEEIPPKCANQWSQPLCLFPLTRTSSTNVEFDPHSDVPEDVCAEEEEGSAPTLSQRLLALKEGVKEMRKEEEEEKVVTSVSGTKLEEWPEENEEEEEGRSSCSTIGHKTDVTNDSTLLSISFTPIPPTPPPPRPSLASSLGLLDSLTEKMKLKKRSLEDPLMSGKEGSSVPAKFMIECETVTKMGRRVKGVVDDEHEEAMRIQRAISKLCIKVNPPMPRRRTRGSTRERSAGGGGRSSREMSRSRSLMRKPLLIRKDFVKENIATAFNRVLGGNKSESTHLAISKRSLLLRGRSKSVKNKKKRSSIAPLSFVINPPNTTPTSTALSATKSLACSGQRNKRKIGESIGGGVSRSRTRARSLGGVGGNYNKLLERSTGELSMPILAGRLMGWREKSWRKY